MSDNKFEGSIPGEIFSRTTRLIELSMANNRLNSTLPTTLGNLGDLSKFPCDTPCCDSIYIILIRFFLDTSLNPLVWNHFLTELFSFARNHLSGSIPRAIMGMVDLETFSIEQNKIDGSIPEGIAALKDLQHFDVQNNKIFGQISTYFGVLRKLTELNVYQNQLTGGVPTQLGYLKALKTLRLDGNKLTGTVPEEVCTLVHESALEFLTSDCTKGSIDCTCCHQCF
jgi:Leucine-rich repeat (LRR) protein